MPQLLGAWSPTCQPVQPSGPKPRHQPASKGQCPDAALGRVLAWLNDVIEPRRGSDCCGLLRTSSIQFVGVWWIVVIWIVQLHPHQKSCSYFYRQGIKMCTALYAARGGVCIKLVCKHLYGERIVCQAHQCAGRACVARQQGLGVLNTKLFLISALAHLKLRCMLKRDKCSAHCIVEAQLAGLVQYHVATPLLVARSPYMVWHCTSCTSADWQDGL